MLTYVYSMKDDKKKTRVVATRVTERMKKEIHSRAANYNMNEGEYIHVMTRLEIVADEIRERYSELEEKIKDGKIEKENIRDEVFKIFSEFSKEFIMMRNIYKFQRDIGSKIALHLMEEKK